MTWKQLSSKLVYQNHYMTVTEEELLTDHGDKVTFGIVRKNPFVIIITWDGTKTLLVGQYRYAIDKFSWEFPMGHVEDRMSLEDSACKELSEETGLVTEHVVEIGSSYPANGHMDQIGHTFITEEYAQGEQKLEPSEKGMKLKWVTLSELDSLILDGTIKDGPTITAYKLFELYLNKK